MGKILGAQWLAALKLSTLVNHFAADQRHQSLGVFDLFGGDGKWILREHGQVGEFSRRQGSFHVLLERDVRGELRVHGERLGRSEWLIPPQEISGLGGKSDGARVRLLQLDY